MDKPISGLAFIEVTDPNPLRIFNQWREEAKSWGSASPSVMNLATCTRDGKVGNRSILILRYDADGFVFLTSHKSRKTDDIDQNPNVASTFLWIYNKEDMNITRQVRIEGIVKETDKGTAREIYEKAPLYAKIRSHICNQGEPIEWQLLKKKHDELLNKVISENIQLDMPDNARAFKLIPEVMDFYFSYDNFIADRVKFNKTKDEVWEYCHLQA